MLNLGARWGGWSIKVMPWLFYSQERALVPTVGAGGWALGPLWMCMEDLAPTGLRILNCPDHIRSLC